MYDDIGRAMWAVARSYVEAYHFGKPNGAKKEKATWELGAKESGVASVMASSQRVIGSWPILRTQVAFQWRRDVERKRSDRVGRDPVVHGPP